MNELELILTDICKCSRINLYSDTLSVLLRDRQFRRLDKILEDRVRRLPLAYSLGYTEFMGLQLKVNKDVLVPRPETEILAEAVIEKVICPCHKDRRVRQEFWRKKSQDTSLKILDIGTGSGCIAIALAKILRNKNIEIVAVDKSKNALIVASDNAKIHEVESRIRFLESDLFSHKLFKHGFKFDIIVSNPPYVPTLEIGVFDATIAYEPKIALDGGLDGCGFYRRISKDADKFLTDDGLLFLEIGDGQSSNIREIFCDKWVIEEFRKDYQGIERVCIMRKKYYNHNPTLTRGEYSNRE